MRDQQFAYDFQHRKDRFIMIREATQDEEVAISNGKPLFNDIANDETFWSSPFSIDELDDFQVCYPGHSSNSDESKWYLPSYLNEHNRFVRVIITT